MNIIEQIQKFQIEIPCWGFADGATRFHKFRTPGAARNIYEELEDAAYVKRLTKVCARVAIGNPAHVGRESAESLNAFARGLDIAIGAMNPGYYAQEEFIFGSLCSADESVRKKAVEVSLESIEIAKITGSDVISLWLPDGTNYPGQDDFVSRKRRLLESLYEIYAVLTNGMRLLIEYKTFEPAFYHTDLADWGMSYAYALKLGERAQVLVDLGHHFQGANIEQIVAFLADEGKIGGFHFNSRKYADDDLIVGTINPYELFLIFNELVGCSTDARMAKTVESISYVIDQSHYIEDKIEAMLRSVLNIQQAYAKALIVDRAALANAQLEGDALLANAILNEAYHSDVRPIVKDAYARAGLDPNPVEAYRAGEYYKAIRAKRN